MKDNVKNSIEHSVNRAASALLAIVKSYDRHGADLTDQQHNVIWIHLSKTFQNAMERAQVSLNAKRKGIGTFSLDKIPEQPTTLVPTAAPVVPAQVISTEAISDTMLAPIAPIAPIAPVAPTAQTSRKAWRKPAGRMAGSKELVYDDTPKAPAKEAQELTAQIDRTGGIPEPGFIDG